LPTKVGIQSTRVWIPAFAGMTNTVPHSKVMGYFSDSTRA
jgi:hypothetical protein